MHSLPEITSLQNPRIKAAVRLRSRHGREKAGLMLIDGARELSRAIAGGVELREVFLCPALCTSSEARQVANTLPDSAQVFQVSEAVFRKLAFGRRAEGILGLAAIPQRTLDSLVLPQNPLVAILEAVEKPGNVGAVIRSADAAGLAAVILADPATDLYNPNAIRASLGTIFTLPVCQAESAEIIAWLRRSGLKIVAARVDGEMTYDQVDYRAPTAILLGSEAAGLSSAWRADDIHGVRLPMCGAADSLNVSVAAAVLFYEALRQRRSSTGQTSNQAAGPNV